MRILTTAAQVCRVAGIDGPGAFPDYPYRDTIPKEVGRALLDGLNEVELPADRDFMNDDGGFIVILDSADEFDARFFGLPPVTLMEDIRRVPVGDDVWWLCVALANNETSIDHVFCQRTCPEAVLAKLIEQVELMADG